jgi:glycosyltransferase involved in cell wall biosynthesis
VHIALLGPTYPYRGGIAHYTTLLYRHLAERHKIALFSFRRQYPRALFPGRSDLDPSTAMLRAPCEYTLDSLNPFTWYTTALRMVRTGAAWVIMPWWVPWWGIHWFTITRVVRSRGLRVLYWCHNVAPHEAGLADRYLTWLALSQGHAYLVHSPRDEGLLREMFVRAPIYRTTLPVLGAFASKAMNREEARQRLGIRRSGPVVLFFGFVRPYKGLYYLIEALKWVREILDVHLLIAGEFWESEKITTDQIRCLGLDGAVTIVNRYIPNEEVFLYFAAADVVVLPYLETSQSAVMQLAHGFGKPVITTRLPGMTSATRDVDERLLVPPRDSQALAQAIATFFTQPGNAPYALPPTEADSWKTMIETIEAAIQEYDQKPN